MKLYMDLGDAWDLGFRSFLVFIFAGLLWLRFVDPIITCVIGLPVPVLIGLLYFYWGWNNAKKAWMKENLEREEFERQREVL
jgi:protein-S-isoprenylcysteine O-methyltransferase Ste14